jgi:sugar lactone lactonase YvrE
MFRSSHTGAVGRFATTVFCGLLAACGGGGGSGDSGTAGASGTGGQSVVGGVSATDTPGGTVTGPTTGTTVGGNTGSGTTTNTGGSTGTGTGTGSATGSGAGGATQGSQANALQARFNAPAGVAFDSAGNLYVADSGNSTIRRITPDGRVTTIAGTAGGSGSADGVGAAARFSNPSNVAADGAGNLYVVDGNNTIRKISPGNVVTTFAGAAGSAGDADGVGAAARFNQPWGIAADGAGNVYVADTQNLVIRKITPAGEVSTIAGIKGSRGRIDGNRASATFLNPRGITIDSAGNLYVTDWFGPPAPNLAETSTVIRKITPAGDVSTIAGNISDGPTRAQFSDAFAIESDSAGNVYIADHQRVRKVSAAGVVTTIVDSAQFTALQGIAMDGAGDLLVADQGRNIVARVTQAGGVTIVAGSATEGGSQDAP